MCWERTRLESILSPDRKLARKKFTDREATLSPDSVKLASTKLTLRGTETLYQDDIAKYNPLKRYFVEL